MLTGFTGAYPDSDVDLVKLFALLTFMLYSSIDDAVNTLHFVFMILFERMKSEMENMLGSQANSSMSAADSAVAWKAHLEQNDTRSRIYLDVYNTVFTTVRSIPS